MVASTYYTAPGNRVMSMSLEYTFGATRARGPRPPVARSGGGWGPLVGVVSGCRLRVVATTTTVQAPTLREAQRAAECVAAAGAGRVLLFGSVACGRAAAGSDIDLVAIFDDIDYSQRHGIRSVLCEASTPHHRTRRRDPHRL